MLDISTYNYIINVYIINFNRFKLEFKQVNEKKIALRTWKITYERTY